jgi:hypothetical protein
MSKGDKNRTMNKKAYDENYDRIFRTQEEAPRREKSDAQLEHERKIFSNIECVTIPKQRLIERMLSKANDAFPNTLKALKDKS